MKPDSGLINDKKSGLKSVLARFCSTFKRLSNVPSVPMSPPSAFQRLSKITKKQSHFPYAPYPLCPLRDTADYDYMKEITKKLAEQVLKDAEYFVSEVKKKLGIK